MKRLLFLLIFILLSGLTNKTYSQSNTVTIVASEDATVGSAYPNTNFGIPRSGFEGLKDILAVGPDNNIWAPDPVGFAVWSNFIKFDLSSIPDDVEILDAELSMRVMQKSNSSSNNDIGLYIVNGNWNETNITYKNKPSIGSTAELSFSTSDCWSCKFDLTNVVKSWLNNNNPNYGISFFSEDALFNQDWSFGFASREEDSEDFRPRLEITYKTLSPQAGIIASPGSFDFGERQVGGTPKRFSFKIESTGDATLQVEPSLTGSDASQFEIIGGASLSLAPGTEEVVEVEYDPSSAGSHSAFLRLNHNATNQSSPLNIDLEGLGVQKKLSIVEVSPSSVTAEPGESVTFAITVEDGDGNRVDGVTIGGSNNVTNQNYQAPSKTNSSGITSYTFSVPSSKPAGNFSVDFTAFKDAYESSNTVTRTVAVSEPPPPKLVISNVSSSVTAEPGESVTFAITVEDGDGSRVSGVTIGGSNNITNQSYQAPSRTNSSGITSYTFTVPSSKPAGNFSVDFTAFKDGYVNSNTVEREVSVKVTDNDPPTVEVLRLKQVSGPKVRIYAKIVDKNQINLDKTKFIIKRVDAKLLTDDQAKFNFDKVSGTNNIYVATAENPRWFQENFKIGTEVVWKIQTEDQFGNQYIYPNDNELGAGLFDRLLELSAERWAYRIKIVDDGKALPKTFLERNGKVNGPITYEVVGNDLSLINNTATWYSLSFEPNDVIERIVNKSEVSFLGEIFPDPKSGIIPLSIDGLLNDRSITIKNALEFESLKITANRFTGKAVFKNTLDLILPLFEASLPSIPSEDIKEIIDLVSGEMDISNVIKMVEKGDREGAIIASLDILKSEFFVLALKQRTKDKLIDKGLTPQKALEKSEQLVGKALAVLFGINNRLQFVIDQFKFVSNVDVLELISSRGFKLDYKTIPGYVSGSNIKPFINETLNTLVELELPDVLIQPYFSVFADLKIYDKDGNTIIESTKIEFNNQNITNGSINLNLVNGKEEFKQGTFLTPNLLSGNKFVLPISFKYNFGRSSTGHTYKSSTQPYFYEIKIFEGGFPGLNLLPEKEELIYKTEKVPFYIFDNTDPKSPTFLEFKDVKSSKEHLFTFQSKAFEEDVTSIELCYGYDITNINNCFEQEINGTELLLVSNTYSSKEDKIYYKFSLTDLSGNKSIYSEIETFNINETDSTPNILIANGPQDGSMIDFSDPTFTWRGSDPDGTVTEYEVDLQGPSPGSFTTTDTTHQFTNLSDGGYLFRVRAIDNEGLASEWAERSFNVDVKISSFTYSGNLEDLTLRAGDDKKQQPETTDITDISSLFTGGSAPISFQVNSSNSNLVSVSLQNETVTVSANGAQPNPVSSTITLTATDNNGNTANGSFKTNVLPAFGDVTADERVNSLDASEILKHKVELIQLNDHQQGVADVNTDNNINSFDASLILQYVVELINDLPFTNSKTVAAKTNVSKTLATSGTIQWGETTTSEEGANQIPVIVKQSRGITSLDFTIAFRETNASSIVMKPEGLPKDWMFIKNITDAGNIKLAMAGTSSLPAGTVFIIEMPPSESSKNINLSGRGFLNNKPFTLEEMAIDNLPEKFILEKNYPNPFNPSTTISYSLPEEAQVRVDIYNITGRLVQKVVSEQQSAGSYTRQVNMAGFSSGIYLVRMQARSSETTFIKTSKMTLIK